jgi:hypothetical protein
MDHHCPWIGNCVGISNQKAFLLYLIYVLSLCLLHSSSFLWNGAACIIYKTDDKGNCRFNFRLTWLEVLNYTTLVVALFFAFFTFVMLAEQMNLIRNNTSTIDKKKGEKTRA